MMTREETRFFVLMMCVFAALFAGARIDSEPMKTAILIVFALVFLAHIRLADTSTRFYGPVWLRRAQWAAVGGLLLAAVLLGRVF